MIRWSFYLLFAATCCFGEEGAGVSRDLKCILEKTFLSDQAKPLLDMVAMDVTMQGEKQVDAAEIVAKFRQGFSEGPFFEKFSKPYRDAFTAEEIAALRKIYESPVWDKYSKEGAQIFQTNLQCLKETFQDLSLTCKAKSVEVAAQSAEIVQITQDNVDQFIGASKKPLIVDVYASWCNPCRMMGPIFEEMNGEYGDRIVFAKIDSDSQGALVQQFGITGLPTILFFKPGQKTPVMKSVGFMNKEDFKTKISQFLKK